jgi:hypothetical protein
VRFSLTRLNRYDHTFRFGKLLQYFLRRPGVQQAFAKDRIDQVAGRRGQDLEMLTVRLGGFGNHQKEPRRLTIERGKLDSARHYGKGDRRFAHAVRTGMGYGDALLQPGAAGVFTCQYGLEKSVPIRQFAGPVQQIHQLFQYVSLGAARQIECNLMGSQQIRQRHGYVPRTAAVKAPLREIP